MTEGTNVLAGTDQARIVAACVKATSAAGRGRVPRYWDGQAASRIEEALRTVFTLPASGASEPVSALPFSESMAR